MQNIIFLDIDGVLNHQLFYEQRGEQYEPQPIDIDEKSMGLLNDLVKSCDGRIVISASCRKNHTLERLQYLFKTKGFKGEIIDVTPVLDYNKLDVRYSVPRGCEIDVWLATHGKWNFKYAILDDDDDMLLQQKDNYFQVDDYCGITYNTIKKLKKHFAK